MIEDWEEGKHRSVWLARAEESQNVVISSRQGGKSNKNIKGRFDRVIKMEHNLGIKNSWEVFAREKMSTTNICLLLLLVAE